MSIVFEAQCFHGVGAFGGHLLRDGVRDGEIGIWKLKLIG
jgi:hypothetical protein